MQWLNIKFVWQDKKSVALLFLCLAMLSFPFSVAATNLFLGLTLATAVLSGFWWHGAKQLWHHYRILSVAISFYLLLVVLGLFWSLDIEWGQRILARHWFWLLLPAVLVILSSKNSRNIFLVAMSVGLTANLVFCVLQANGLVDSPTVAGSSIENATGHIGHTSFGFIYGVWAAWLLHLGFTFHDEKRWLLWSLSAWSLIMVFLAEGKSGYIISILLVFFVAVKWLQESGNRKMFASFALLLLLVFIFMAFGPAKQRLAGSWQALTGSVQGDLNANQKVAISSITSRLEWWEMSYEIWLEKPYIGNGTGSFPQAATVWESNQVDVQEFAVSPVHPHNQYLLVMVRWGSVGLLSLLALLYFWIHTGISNPWRGSIALPLVSLSGTALLIHGLSSSSFEEHFSTIFALILLGVGLSEASPVINDENE